MRYWIALLALGLAALPSAARVDPPAYWDELFGGKYVTADGYLFFSIDDSNRVEGYYRRNGVFGEIRGRFDGVAVHGHWMRSSGETNCAAPMDGYRFWGAIELDLTAPDRISAKQGVCSAPFDTTWTAKR